MGKFLITEEEKNDILSKYSDGTSNEVLTHLKRNFPVYELKLKWLSTPIKQILVDDKLMMLEKNKKNLVSRIYNLIEERFPSIEESVLRRTIKKYLDGIK